VFYVQAYPHFGYCVAWLMQFSYTHNNEQARKLIILFLSLLIQHVVCTCICRIQNDIILTLFL